jgi:excinuclease UvrABC nuclease subunit
MHCNPSQQSRLFRLKEIERLPQDAYGVYAFWFRDRCLYVGKAQDQPLVERLKQHWQSCHNQALRQWLIAKPVEIKFITKVISDRSRIPSFERFYIHRFQPITNKIRYHKR